MLRSIDLGSQMSELNDVTVEKSENKEHVHCKQIKNT